MKIEKPKIEWDFIHIDPNLLPLCLADRRLVKGHSFQTRCFDNTGEEIRIGADGKLPFDFTGVFDFCTIAFDENDPVNFEFNATVQIGQITNIV